MYGMVNRALEELICREHGEAVWERIRTEAGVDVEVFMAHQSYPDDVTYRLVGAACGQTGLAGEELLERFGIHWVTVTAAEGYADLMASGGKTLRDFLTNLPDFHTRVGLLFPHLRPPQFRCSQVEAHSLHLHYSSFRPGLTPFVRGLVLGLGQLFETPVEVRLVSSESPDGGAEDEFLVTWPGG